MLICLASVQNKMFLEHKAAQHTLDIVEIGQKQILPANCHLPNSPAQKHMIITWYNV